MTLSRLYEARLLAPLAEQLVAAAGVRSPMRVLDVRAGTGRLSRLLCSALAPGGSVVALEDDAGRARVLAAELRDLRGRRPPPNLAIVDIGGATAGAALPFRDGEFDAALSLLRITAASGGAWLLEEMARVAGSVVLIIEGERPPLPARLLARAWGDLTGTAPAELSPTGRLALPAGWTTSTIGDVARFDGEEQLTAALVEQYRLSPPAALLPSLRERFGALLVPHTGADNTLRIGFEVTLVHGPG